MGVILAVAGVLLAVALIAVGLALSPAPWLALIWLGGALLAALLYDTEEATD